MDEKKDEEDSTLNEGEAEVAMAHAKRLVQSGVQASDIGIITPYAAQVWDFLLWALIAEIYLQSGPSKPGHVHNSIES